MASTDKVILYPEARLALTQIGFDTATKTLDDLIKGDYIKNLSTVVEYIDDVSDTAFKKSLATKFGSFFSENTGIFMIINKSVKAYSFIFLELNGFFNMSVMYHIESGWSSINSISGYQNVSLSNTGIVPIYLRRSGDVKYLRIAGNITKDLTMGTQYTVGTIPTAYKDLLAPAGGTVYKNLLTNASGDIISLNINSSGTISITPRGKNLSSGYSINIDTTYI